MQEERDTQDLTQEIQYTIQNEMLTCTPAEFSLLTN